MKKQIFYRVAFTGSEMVLLFELLEEYYQTSVSLGRSEDDLVLQRIRELMWKFFEAGHFPIERSEKEDCSNENV